MSAWANAFRTATSLLVIGLLVAIAYFKGDDHGYGRGYGEGYDDAEYFEAKEPEPCEEEELYL